MVAVSSGHTDCVRVLVEAGADKDVTSSNVRDVVPSLLILCLHSNLFRFSRVPLPALAQGQWMRYTYILCLRYRFGDRDIISDLNLVSVFVDLLPLLLRGGGGAIVSYTLT
jgi:hypothetical protein